MPSNPDKWNTSASVFQPFHKTCVDRVLQNFYWISRWVSSVETPIAPYPSDHFLSIPRSRYSQSTSSSLYEDSRASRNRVPDSPANLGRHSRGRRFFLRSCLLNFVFVLIFIAAPGIIRRASFQHAICHPDDHAKPHYAKDLKHEKHAQKHPFNAFVQADCAILIGEWFQILPRRSNGIRSFQLPGCTRITAIIHNSWHITVYGPAERNVDDMTGNKPNGEENSKRRIASFFVVEVFEDFC